MAWFTANPDEALIIDGENEVRCLLHELQVRYPLGDFVVWDIECAHLFHNLRDAKRALNAIGTFAKYKCQIVEVAFAPLKKVPRG